MDFRRIQYRMRKVHYHCCTSHDFHKYLLRLCTVRLDLVLDAQLLDLVLDAPLLDLVLDLALDLVL